MQPSFGIIAPNYGRPKILRLWCSQIKRLRKELDTYIPACIISEEEDKAVCDEYFINHVTHDNHPVTAKFNRGCEWVKKQGFDYMIIMGSDDIMSTDTLQRLMEDMNKGYQMIGINSIYFYGAEGSHRGKLVHLKGERLLGTCKCIRRDILKEVNWKPWHREKSWGMDALVTQSIAPYVKSKSIISDTIVCDVKSKTNINFAGLWFQKIRIKSDPNIFYNILSDEEKEILKTI